MCGRYTIDDGEEVVEMRKIFEKLRDYYSGTEEYRKVKRGEIFPTYTVPVIIPERSTNVDIIPMQWGFKPVQAGGRALINARSETVFEKPTFRESIRNRRCVIPANGFFEWANRPDENGKPKKQKYLIEHPESPTLFFAGIYDEKLELDHYDKPNSKKKLVHFVILTRESRGLVRSLHHRMPVTMAKRDILKWLNGGEKHIRELCTDLNIPEFKFRESY